MSVKFTGLALCMSMIALAGCGGSKGVDREPEVAESVASISGKVIDGYVVGATVWFDFNANGKYDEDSEPSTVSTESGDYSIPFSQEELSCVPYSTMYVDVPVGAIDEDLGEVTEAYQMAFPPSIEPITDDEIRNVTPLTSVLWGQLRSQLKGSGKGNVGCEELRQDTELRTALIDEIRSVMNGIVAHYNISEEQIYSDFIKNDDSQAYDIAQSIVKGLKAAYKRKKEIEDENPKALATVLIYQSAKHDEEYGFENGWYRDEIISFEGEDFIQNVKLRDNGSLADVDRVISNFHEYGEPWGDQDYKGWLTVRDDAYYTKEGFYNCGSVERIIFSIDGVEFGLGNTVPYVQRDTYEECGTANFASPDEISVSSRYSEDDASYLADIYFRQGNEFFYRFPGWVNVRDKAESLDFNELVSHFADVGFGWDTEVSVDSFYWHKRKEQENVTVDKYSDGIWNRTTRLEDGTSTFECSEDGVSWVPCTI